MCPPRPSGPARLPARPRMPARGPASAADAALQGAAHARQESEPKAFRLTGDGNNRMAVRNRKAVRAGEMLVVGIKKVTVGTTAYFLPDEAARMDAVAAEPGVSKHELIILALDRMLAGRGEPPVRRYAASTVQPALDATHEAGAVRG